MEFDKAKKAIQKMAEDIEQGSFTQKDLTEFILEFRFELFQSKTIEKPSNTAMPYLNSYCGAITCSCGPQTDSCIECGEGFTTGFSAEEETGNIVKFKIKK